MFRYVILMVAALTLGACGTTANIIDKEFVNTKPSEALYQCNEVNTLPNPDTLTDKQIAQLIVKLVKTNKECYNSLKAIHAFNETATGIIQVPKNVVMQVRKNAKLSRKPDITLRHVTSE